MTTSNLNLLKLPIHVQVNGIFKLLKILSKLTVNKKGKVVKYKRSDKVSQNKRKTNGTVK